MIYQCLQKTALAEIIQKDDNWPIFYFSYLIGSSLHFSRCSVNTCTSPRLHFALRYISIKILEFDPNYIFEREKSNFVWVWQIQIRMIWWDEQTCLQEQSKAGTRHKPFVWYVIVWFVWFRPAHGHCKLHCNYTGSKAPAWAFLQFMVQDSQDSQYPKFWWYWQSQSQDSRDAQNPQFGGHWESRESWLRDCQYHQNLGVLGVLDHEL